MGKIKDFFDDFNFHARVMPSMVITIPLILFGIFKSIINTNLFESSSYIFVLLVVLTLLSQIARNQGKKYEDKMVKKLNTWPTTIILRYSDNKIDTITKNRYHMKLANKLKDIEIPQNIDGENESSDIVYTSAMNWLRNHANENKEMYPLVYKELRDYNFWRNLYGLKHFGILLYILIAIREIITIDSFSLKTLFVSPYPQYVAFILMIISIMILLVGVTEDIVVRKAFDYARTLAEVCERI